MLGWGAWNHLFLTWISVNPECWYPSWGRLWISHVYNTSKACFSTSNVGFVFGAVIEFCLFGMKLLKFLARNSFKHSTVYVLFMYDWDLYKSTRFFLGGGGVFSVENLQRCSILFPRICQWRGFDRETITVRQWNPFIEGDGSRPPLGKPHRLPLAVFNKC